MTERFAWYFVTFIVTFLMAGFMSGVIKGEYTMMIWAAIVIADVVSYLRRRA